MAPRPNLGKSASLCSLDMSNHMISLGSQSQLATTTSSYLPLSDANDVQVNNPWDDDAPSYENSVFGTQTLDSKGNSNSNSNSNSNMRRSPSVLFKLIVEEEAQKAVSCEHIAFNLIADSSREVDPDRVYHVNDNREEEASYWDMPSETATATTTGQIERLLVEDALRRVKEEMDCKPTVTDSHPNNSYWNWPSEPVLESEKKSNLIASILLEEAIREQLSINQISDLESSNKHRPRQQIHATATSSSSQQQQQQQHMSTNYWRWNADGEQEEKHEIVAPHVHDASHPHHAYWDFPNQSRAPQDIQKQLIDKILKEERIRTLLSIEAVGTREANYHRSKSMNDQSSSDTTRTIHAPTSVLNSVPSNYWDMNPIVDDLLQSLPTHKQQVIHQILEEEKQRYIVSTENIEHNLLLNSHDTNNMIEKERCSMEESCTPTVESYWDW